MRNRMVKVRGIVLMLAAFFVLGSAATYAQNLLPDPSFEKSMTRNRWGHVFEDWSGWVFPGGKPTFEVGQVARTGKTSLEIVGTIGGKIRMYSKEVILHTGRYRLTLHLRGLDLGKGKWGRNFDMSVDQAKYVSMKKSGSFGWTPMTYVFDVPEGFKFKLAFGLHEEGHVWIDDASLEKVDENVALTPQPVFGKEEAPIAMPGPLGANPVRCPNCAYRNNPAWGKCYACGSKLGAGEGRAYKSPAVVVFADFEDGKKTPFSAGVVVAEHATSGKFALRLDKSYTTFDVYLDNFRLERLDTSGYTFDELFAFDFGPMTAPLMEGFTAAGMATSYSKGRGYGWTNANWWREFNVLQPELLYQDFVCPRNVTFRMDVPNGKYHVFMNIDSPNGFWGEVQLYRQRTVTANGEVVVDDRMDLDRFTKKYFRNASREDLPGIDTFEAYVEKMFDEKRFEVEVTDGKLELGLRGEGWAICLSALVVYPDTQKAKGEKFLAWVKERRRKQFEDYFKQTNPPRVGLVRPAAGYRVFKRDFMTPAQAADGPREGEELKPGERIELTVAKFFFSSRRRHTR